MNQTAQPSPRTRWLNRTVLGIGLASLLSDWSHEIATAVMPAFLATMGAAAVWLGVIEGVSDGLSSFAKMGSGYFTDQMRRRKPIAVVGYIVTATGTACIGLATQAWHVLLCRSSAWLGRGVRTPVRKALLAAAVTPETYGRAFGFERMMDTCGAIVGPVTATILLAAFAGNFSRVLLVTLVPGLLASVAIAFLVEEKERLQVKYISFRARLTALPKPFQRFLLAVGLFGAGDFAHTMLILLATQRLKPQYGAGGATTIAVSLYILHNVLYAGFAFVAGWLADHFDKRALLAGGYALAAVMGLVLVFAPMSPAPNGVRSGVNLAVLAVVFVLAGIYVATEEALEDSLAAELVDKEHHGMGFGVLATVNGVGDFVSSIVVGLLWTVWGTQVAFAYSTVLFTAGTVAVWRLRKA
jgi:MFS family permease